MSASSGLMSSWQKIERIYTKTQRLPVTINAESSAVIFDIWRPIVLNLEGKKNSCKYKYNFSFVIVRTVLNKEDSHAKLNWRPNVPIFQKEKKSLTEERCAMWLKVTESRAILW